MDKKPYFTTLKGTLSKQEVSYQIENGKIGSAEVITDKGKMINIDINKQSFPYNWYNYRFKIALLAKRFLSEEKYLIYQDL